MLSKDFKLRELLKDVVMELVDTPDAVSVSQTVSEGGGTVILTVKTGTGDAGKVIGKAGRIAKALRVLLEAMSAKYKTRVMLEIADSTKGETDNGNRRFKRTRNGQTVADD